MEMTVLDSRPDVSTVLWVIQNFQKWPFDKYFSIKCRFSVGSSTDWDLAMYCSKEDLNLSLTLITCTTSLPVEFYVKLSIVDANFNEINRLDDYLSLDGIGSWHNFPKFLCDFLNTMSQDNDFLIDGDLVVLLEITVFQSVSNLHNVIFNDSKLPLKESMKTLLKSGNYSDFKIIIGDREFNCHRCILSSRSKVFEAMLTHDLDENQKNELVLMDIEPSIMEKLLTYIYTGDIAVSHSDAMPLLVAADKYSLEKLVTQCEEKIRSRLYLEDAFWMYEFSDKYNLKTLKHDVDKIIKVFSKQLKKRYDPNVCISIDPSLSENNSNELQKFIAKSKIPNAKVWYHTTTQKFEPVIWQINEFQKCFGKIGASIRSSNLCIGKYINEKVLFNVRAFESNNYLSFDISCTAVVNDYNCLNFRVSILDTNNEEIGDFHGVSQTSRLNISNDFMLIDDIIRNDELLHGGTLVLCFHFMVRKTFQLNSEEKTLDTTTDLTDDLSTLLSCSSCSDLIVKVDTAEFKCHKAILATRSTFFETELSKRPELTVMEISDVALEIFIKVLQYIYFEKLDILESSLPEFLPIVLRFGLEELRFAIEKRMDESLAIFDVQQTVTYADADGSYILRGKDSGLVTL